MSKDNPRRSFSQKLREIGRIRARQSDLDKRDSQSQLRFQIVHTPDRLTPGRPTPTEEECCEEIMRWHAEADRVRGWSWGEGDEKGKKDEVAMMAERGGEEGLGRVENHDYSGVGVGEQERGRRRFVEGRKEEGEEQQGEEIKKKKKKKKKSGKTNKYEFDDGSGSDGADIDDGTVSRATGRVEARAEVESWDISNRRNRDTFGQDRLDGDPLRILKRDDTQQRSRQRSLRGEGGDSRTVNTDTAAHYSHRDSNDGYPIFHPPRPHRPEKPEFSVRKDIPPMFIGSQAVPVAAQWDMGDNRAPFHAPIPIRPLRPRSPSISSLANVSDDSDEGASGSRLDTEAESAAAPVDKDRLIKMELYRRGVCPFCRKMLSRIEAVRCSGCGADLMSISSSSSSNRPRKKEPAVSRSDVPRIQVTPPPQSSSAPPVVTASATAASIHRSPPRGRPPEPLRKRLYQPIMLDVHEKSPRENAQAVADKDMIRFAHFPLEPLPSRSKSDGERARGQHTQQQPQLQRRNASAGRKKDENQKDRVSEYHRWQTPAQRAEMRRLIHENGDDADLFMDIYSGYDD